MGKRPDYAVVVYSNLIRQVYKHTPIILGGIEASLRRLAHYDYWSDKLKRSILLDSGADLLSYGMGERSIVEIAEALDSGIDVKDLTFVPGTVYKTKSMDSVYDALTLPGYDELKADKLIYARSFYTQYCNTDPFSGKRLVEPYGEHLYVVQNPPAKPLSQSEMDRVYSYPYMRTYHPSYEEKGGVPAISEVKFSLISNRGCFGGCSFCALTFHQGRIIQTRSHESLLAEAGQFIWDKDFKGYIHDVGGPTANFRHPSCEKQLEHGACKTKQCLFPRTCKNLNVDHKDYIVLLRKLRELPNVKKVFIRSGTKKYKKINQEIHKEQYLVPYLMSSHPGSTMKEAVELAEYLRDLGYMPEQVQDFYPTPSTLSTCMYYTGVDPRDMKPVYVPRNPHEKAMQRALIQYRNPKNYDLVLEALKKAGRMDLVGYDKHCLIRPRQKDGRTQAFSGKNAGGKTRSSDRKTFVGKEQRKKRTIRNVHKKKTKK